MKKFLLRAHSKKVCIGEMFQPKSSSIGGEEEGRRKKQTKLIVHPILMIWFLVGIGKKNTKSVGIDIVELIIDKKENLPPT